MASRCLRFGLLGITLVLALPAPSDASADPTRLGIENVLARWMDDAAQVAVRVHTGSTRGSGTLVSTRHVLTAAHVVGDAETVDVELDGQTVHARVLRSDTTRDLALLELPVDAPTCVPIATEPPEAGSWVASAGFLGGSEHALDATTTVGFVVDTTDLLAVQQGIAHGMSGGPVLTPRGELAGVIVRVTAARGVVADDELLEGVSCDRVGTAYTLPAIAFDPAAWNTTRSTGLAAQARSVRGTSSLASSVVQLSRDDIYTRGVVVAPELVITSVDATIARRGSCELLQVVGQEALACEGATIAGELMLVRFPGLVATPLVLDGSASPAARGTLISSADGATWGVVDASAVAPGELVPFAQQPTGDHICGTHLRMRREQSPVVRLGTVIAHDVQAERGQLLVDARGHALAIHAGDHVDGRGYAVPIREALTRFALTP